MATSTSLGRLITTEWIDGSSVKRSHPAASEEDFVNLEFAEELYGTLLSVFAQICRTYSKTFTVPKQRQNKEALGRLHLWGRALVQEGKLACVLAQSDDVRDTVIDLFGQIGKAVLDLADLEGCDNEFAEQVQSLQTLIARSRLIVPASESSDTGSDDDSAAGLRSKRRSRLGDAGSARRKGHFEGVKVKGDLDPELEQVEFDLESDTHTRPYDLRTDRSRNGTSESSEDEEDGSDHDTLLECHIECLMDLVPTMEQSLARLRSGGIQAPTSTRVPFLVSDLALPWVQNVSDKFGSADQALIERLGEANWQRYMTLRARTEQMVQSLDIEEGVAEDFPVVQIFQTVPHSVFKPHSLFHDSGMGSSVPTLPRYAMSVASHTSFLSSLVDDGALALQVPPTPVEVDLGKPFRCEICGHLLSNIKNRVDWKIHVFADLQPYICTFESCSKDLTTFPTRNLWASHEFEEHRVTRSWKCPECAYTDSAAQKLEEHLRRCHGEAVTLAQLPFIIAAAETKTPQAIEGQACPLCKAIPGKSRRNFVKHVGRHMESVALAVLPRDAAEDSEQSSDRSIVSQDEEPHSPEITSETEECYFFVPPNFNIYTTLDGRDQELEVLDKYLFSERWKYGTASVLLHGPHLSGKSRLAQYYINRNRSKFPGGIFWISSRSSLLMIAQKFIWKTYKSGISTDLLASIVTAWFSSKSRWLIVLWDIYSRSDSTEEGLQPPWPAVAPNSRCSSLIYVSTFMSSNMPLSPMPLEIKPLRNTEQQRTEQNGESNISATNSDTGGIRRLPPIISTEANITADSVLHTIGAETGRLDNSARGIYGAMSEVYQDELFDEIYDPTALRTMSPQSRVTENQARPGSPQNGSLKDELKTARQSHSAPADPPPALGGLSTIGDGFDHNSEAFPNIIDYINKQDEARFDHGPQDRGPIGAISASTDIADDARTTWERSFRHVSENPPSNASPFLLSNHGAISDFPPHLTSMSIPSVSGMHLEELFDDTKSGLLMQSLPCEHPGCSVTSKSISEYTEHCEASHGEMLADMSKTLSDIRENAVKAQWLLEQPVISPKRTSRPKLTTQNLKADLFHNKQIHTTGEIEPSGYEFKPKSYDEQGEKKIAYNGTLLGGREFRPRTFLILDKGDTFFMLASECALMLGYWNSYILFDENPWLYKIILNRSEKDDLVIRKILTLSSLTREIDVVTARSMFRQFGSRIILNGRRVRDDYWEESARAQGFSISNGTRTLILPDDEVPRYGNTSRTTPSQGPRDNASSVKSLETQEVDDATVSPKTHRPRQSRAEARQARREARQSRAEARQSRAEARSRQSRAEARQSRAEARQSGVEAPVEPSATEPLSDVPLSPLQSIPPQHDHILSGLANHNIVLVPEKVKSPYEQVFQEATPQRKLKHSCPSCPRVFSRYHNLKSHLLTHNNEKAYVCQTCDALFRRLHDLKRHTKLHIGERPYTCQMCNVTFVREEALERHMMSPGGCASQQSTTHNREMTLFGSPLPGDEEYSSSDDEYSSSEVEDPTKAPKAATYPSINDRTHSESLALGVASNLDGSHGFFYRGFCKRCHHYDHARSIDISTMSEGHTIIKCDECELPTVILESELLSTPAHRGCLKCYVPGCDLSRDFTNERELQSHRRGLHRMHEADVRWIEETTAPGTTKYETQMSLATPYKCDEPGCSMLRDFSSRNDLRRHQQEIHKLTSTASLQGPSGREAVTQGPTLTSNTEDTIRCICGQEEYPGLAKSARDAFNSATYHNRTSRSFFAVDPEHLGSLLIQCDTCKVWQHGNCVNIRNAASCPDQYFCEQCEPQYHFVWRDPSTGLRRSRRSSR